MGTKRNISICRKCHQLNETHHLISNIQLRVSSLPHWLLDAIDFLISHRPPWTNVRPSTDYGVLVVVWNTASISSDWHLGPSYKNWSYVGAVIIRKTWRGHHRIIAFSSCTSPAGCFQWMKYNRWCRSVAKTLKFHRSRCRSLNRENRSLHWQNILFSLDKCSIGTAQRIYIAGQAWSQIKCDYHDWSNSKTPHHDG
jgi:hypothetical protein